MDFSYDNLIYLSKSKAALYITIHCNKEFLLHTYVCKVSYCFYTFVVANIIKFTHHKSNKVHPAFSSDEDVDDNDDSYSQSHVSI